MRWVLLFGGIVLFALVLYACIGVWLWRRAKELFLELGLAADKLDRAMAEVEDQDRAHSAPTESGAARRA
ncbi:hypothetical protein [Tenggerimyces flavus]|uniref:Uncharacterized protein n=1 Tax=Tenggerimyces flavus TaxID=1708749 RepID=A0ABV7Y639_9ACTN|nr:hypothetical protein [Tenggerimyces flavus]MBM7788261.1 hypothetical protein [Tenggerimyces flavus]